MLDPGDEPCGCPSECLAVSGTSGSFCRQAFLSCTTVSVSGPARLCIASSSTLSLLIVSVLPWLFHAALEWWWSKESRPSPRRQHPSRDSNHPLSILTHSPLLLGVDPSLHSPPSSWPVPRLVPSTTGPRGDTHQKVECVRKRESTRERGEPTSLYWHSRRFHSPFPFAESP